MNINLNFRWTASTIENQVGLILFFNPFPFVSKSCSSLFFCRLQSILKNRRSAAGEVEEVAEEVAEQSEEEDDEEAEDVGGEQEASDEETDETEGAGGDAE